MANSHGLDLIGVVPSHETYSYAGMLDGAKALILSHLDPAQDPDMAATLKEKDLLVVHDSFLTDTAVIADVVLPAKTVYERDGTIVNLEGRFLTVNAAPVEAGSSEDFTGLVRYLGDALGARLEGRSVRSARRVLRKDLDLDLAELPVYGVIPAQAVIAKLRRPGRRAMQATTPRPGGNMLITASMARSEYLQRNPHLRAALGGPRLRVHPEDGAAHGLQDGNDVRLRVAGLWRRATVHFTEAVPSGLMTLPSLPDQPHGLVQADLASLVVERAREELVRDEAAT
jgi:NADH-quinone oxidoreductase subunit G